VSCLPRPLFEHPVVAGVGDVDGSAALHRHTDWSTFNWWVASMSDQVRVWERPVGEMALERYLLPTLIGHSRMGKVIAAAAATIALAPFSVLATTPGAAQAAPWAPCAGVWADSITCQNCLLPVAQYRMSTPRVCYEAVSHPAAQTPPSRVPVQTPAAPPEPAPTVTPVQTPQVVPPSLQHSSTIPVVAAQEDPTRPWWRFALHYGVLVIAVCLVAWMIHRFAKMWSAPMTTSALGPPRRGFGWGGFGGVPIGRKRMVLVEAGHRCAIPTCRHPTTEIAHIVPESEDHDDSFENLIALCPDCQTKKIDRHAIRMYKRNLGILNSRYSDFERRVFDQIAETGRRSFTVEAGLEIPLLHAVNDGLLKRVELAPVAIQRGEPTHYHYEVTDEGLDFVNRYVCGEDIS
jgi:HNH endonuclease